MKSSLLSPESIQYSSVHWHDSENFVGVKYAIHRISLLQRIELTRAVQELMHKHEFLRAGTQSDQVDANLAELLVRKVYIDWGLAAVQGLSIDGQEATPGSLVELGPESLAEEIVATIRTQLELSEEERKNF